MRNLEKLEVGQLIYVSVKEKGNTNEQILEGEIIKIGRKHITVEFCNIENSYKNCCDYEMNDCKFCLTKESISEDIEGEKLYKNNF